MKELRGIISYMAVYHSFSWWKHQHTFNFSERMKGKQNHISVTPNFVDSPSKEGTAKLPASSWNQFDAKSDSELSNDTNHTDNTASISINITLPPSIVDLVTTILTFLNGNEVVKKDTKKTKPKNQMKN
jgi:hypothetical protein